MMGFSDGGLRGEKPDMLRNSVGFGRVDFRAGVEG